MRNTASAGKTFSTIVLSSRAEERSWPNGFSMTTRRQEALEEVERPLVVEAPGDEADALGQGTPDLLAERRPSPFTHRLVDDLAEVLVGPVPAREADEREPRREEPAVREVVDGRHELLASQVAGDTEEHQGARARDPREPLVPVVAQRVGPRGHLGRAHARPRPMAARTRRMPSSWSVMCSRSTGRPCSARTVASPPACAAMNSPKVKLRPGTSRSLLGVAVICTYTPVGGPPLWYCPVEWRKRGPQPKVAGRPVRSKRSRATCSRSASASRSRYAMTAMYPRPRSSRPRRASTAASTVLASPSQSPPRARTSTGPSVKAGSAPAPIPASSSSRAA